MTDHFPALDVAGQTDVGLKRSRNEDSFTVMVPPQGSPQLHQGALFVVADGMGGMGGGDVASKATIEELIRQFYAADAPDYDPLARLRTALEAANVRVREAAQTVGLPRIGATGAGMALTPTGDAVVFNVGDSRVYRARGSYIELLTRDQSVMASQLEQGLVTQEEAKLSRNVNVTAFIGQPTPITPVYSRMQTQPGDIFIVCSDGLWDLVEPNEMLKIVQAPAQAAARKLIALARKRGAPDNVTVIVVRMGHAPRAGLPVLLIAVVALLIVVGGGILVLSQGGLGAGGTATPTQTATPTMVASAATTTPTRVQALTDASAEVVDTSSPVAIISIATATDAPPTATRVPPSRTPTATLSAAQALALTASATATATRTASATLTRRPTSTATPSPTITPSSTPQPSATRRSTRTPTNTPTPTPSATDTPTRAPTATWPAEATVTLNPSLFTATARPARPTPVSAQTVAPAQSHEALILAVAADEGVALATSAILYDYNMTSEQGASLVHMDATAEASAEAMATGEATVATEAPAMAETSAMADSSYDMPRTLPAGTQVKLLSEYVLRTPSTGNIALRYVRVLSGDHNAETGWLALSALTQAAPISPRAITTSAIDRGANVRAGEGRLSAIIGALLPGQYAKILAVSTSPLRWLYVELPGGGRGWIDPSTVDVEGDMSNVERRSPPPTLTPTATDTPTSAPTSTEFGAI